MQEDEVTELHRLLEVSSRCIGPCGQAVGIRSSDAPGARTFISSSAGAVLQSWPVARTHHVVRLVIDAAEAHLRQHKDGGWLFLNLSLRLALSLLGLTRQRGGLALEIPPPSRAAALHGLALASVWVDEALREEACPCRQLLDWSALQPVLAAVRSALCKPVVLSHPEDARHLEITILEAFLEVLPSCTPSLEDGTAAASANVRFLWFCGPEVTWSSSWRGLVLETPASMAWQPRLSEDAIIALFDASLEKWLPSDTAPEGTKLLGLESLTVETQLSAGEVEAHAVRKWELAQFSGLAASLLAAGVRVLACQKLVDPWLEDHLLHNGVTVLSRLSIRHIDYMRRLTGAVPVTSLAALPGDWRRVCGVVGPIEVRSLCERSYTFVSGPAKGSSAPSQRGPAPVSTLLLAAPDEHALSELKRCAPQAVHSLEEVARSGVALQGGGLTEVYLGDRLAAHAREILGEDVPVAAALQTAAEAFWDVGACLPANAKQRGGALVHRGDFLEEVRAAIQCLREGGSAKPVGILLEAEGPKRHALLGALDLAGILVRLGGTVDFVTTALG